MKIVFNGETREIPDGESLARALERLGVPTQPVAIAVNLDFVPRSRWETTVLNEGDEIEALVAHQGG